MASPLKSVQAGINLTFSRSKTDVYISKGIYNSATTLQLANGVSLYGGYDASNKLVPLAPEHHHSDRGHHRGLNILGVNAAVSGGAARWGVNAGWEGGASFGGAAAGQGGAAFTLSPPAAANGQNRWNLGPVANGQTGTGFGTLSQSGYTTSDGTAGYYGYPGVGGGGGGGGGGGARTTSTGILCEAWGGGGGGGGVGGCGGNPGKGGQGGGASIALWIDTSSVNASRATSRQATVVRAGGAASVARVPWGSRVRPPPAASKTTPALAAMAAMAATAATAPQAVVAGAGAGGRPLSSSPSTTRRPTSTR